MNQEQLFKIILSPHMSEKAAIGKEKREYVFRVLKTATKIEVKHSIEQLFKTKVQSVRIVNVKAKQKRFRNIQGVRKGWKKAYVTLEPNQSIDLIGA